MKKNLLVILILLLTIFSTTKVFANSFSLTKADVEIDSKNCVITLSYNGYDSADSYWLEISKNMTNGYPIKFENKKESFPLTSGEGTYKLLLFKKIEHNYVFVDSQTIFVVIDNYTCDKPFLSSVQHANWNNDMDSIKFAKQLTRKLKTNEEKINAIYHYLISNLRYEYEKLEQIKNVSYIPTIDDTFNSNKGICSDFSALFASMLRSIGIPTKVVYGYVKDSNTYHAWNSVYDSQKNIWVLVDITFDINNVVDQGLDAKYYVDGKIIQVNERQYNERNPNVYVKIVQEG